MAITQRQQRFLLDRLEGIRHSKPGPYDGPKLPESPAVKRARKQITAAQRVVKAHDRRASARWQKRNEAIRIVVAGIKQVILFGDAPRAIKLLDAFELKTY